MEIFCVKDLLFSKTRKELEWFFVKLKTIVLVIIIKPYMVFVFQILTSNGSQTKQWRDGRISVHQWRKPQFSKVRGFPCSNMIGYEWRLLSSLLVDWFLLVADDVVVYLSDQSETRFSRVAQSEENILWVVFASFAYCDHLLIRSK